MQCFRGVRNSFLPVGEVGLGSCCSRSKDYVLACRRSIHRISNKSMDTKDRLRMYE